MFARKLAPEVAIEQIRYHSWAFSTAPALTICPLWLPVDRFKIAKQQTARSSSQQPIECWGMELLTTDILVHARGFDTLHIIT